jgi:hypothetical protein
MDMEAACCHLGGDQHIVGWIQVVFPGTAKLGAVMKPFSQGNSQFPGHWIAPPELLRFTPGRPCLGAGWSWLADWKVQRLT